MEMYIDQYRWNKGVQNGAHSIFGEVEKVHGFQQNQMGTVSTVVPFGTCWNPGNKSEWYQWRGPWSIKIRMCMECWGPSKILFKDVQSRYIASCAISPSKKLRLGRFPASKFGVSSWHASLNYLHGWFGGPACPRIWVVTPKNGRKTVGNPMVLYLFYIAKAAEFPQIPWGKHRPKAFGSIAMGGAGVVSIQGW